MSELKPNVDCPFNFAIHCEDKAKRCSVCGWDPKVSAKRKRDYRETLRPLYRSGMIIKFKEKKT